MVLVKGCTIQLLQVLSESFTWGGDQGILAAGFWDNHWEPSLLCGTIGPALQKRAYEVRAPAVLKH